MPKIVGMCFETAVHDGSLRIHQNGEDDFILELDHADKAAPTTMDFTLSGLEAMVELVSFVKKRQTMVRNLLKDT